MPPKSTKAAAAKKATASTSAHGSYQDMIKEAILNLKQRNGSSRPAIKKYIKANNNLGATSDASFNNHVSKALKAGEAAGVFSLPNGPSGSVKLAKKDSVKKETKPKEVKEKPAEKKTTTTTTKKEPAAKKTATKKEPAAKKEAPKKATAKKETTKKPAAKPKANTTKPRKTSTTAAPAVEEKPVVLGKTKSGRVTKSTPNATTAAKKSAATKKTATATKKKATPKKATPKKDADAPAAEA